MAQSLNRVFLIGRLGRDAELRHTPDGKPVATLSLATNRHGPAAAEAAPDWHRIVCWGELADFAARYLTKGRLVHVTGRLAYRAWKGRGGEQHRAAEIVAGELLPLDRRPDADLDDQPDEADEAEPV
jgi:single-strand DNA-binding protein